MTDQCDNDLRLQWWKLLDLLRWLMWENAMPPWEEFQEGEDDKIQAHT